MPLALSLISFSRAARSSAIIFSLLCLVTGKVSLHGAPTSPSANPSVARPEYDANDSRSEPLADSTDTTINTALKPTPKLENNGYFWFKRHEAILALQKARQPEFVLIGDSITHNWGGEPTKDNEPGKKSPPDSAAWKELWANRNVINLGFGWDRTQNVLWRLEHGEVEGIQPKVIVLAIGTNNLTPTQRSRANTPEEISAARVAIVELLRQRCPRSRIIVMGIFPRREAPPTLTMKAIDRTNELTAQALAGKSRIQFLNLRNALLEPDGTLSSLTFPDGTHPSEAGYRVWAQSLLDAGIFTAQ